MIKGVNLAKELVISGENKVGMLSNIAKILADHDINIEGVAGYAVNNQATIMITADDNLRAGDALKKAGYKSVRESEIIMVDLENKAGALKVLTAKLAQEKVDIKYTYGTICAAGCPARLAISTSDNQKAFIALKK